MDFVGTLKYYTTNRTHRNRPLGNSKNKFGLKKTVTAAYADYEPTKAARLIEDFVIENLSNWYIAIVSSLLEMNYRKTKKLLLKLI